MINKKRNYSEITADIRHYAALCRADGIVEPELYTEHKIFRGLRDLNGNGVRTGLTEVSEIISKKELDGTVVPCEGELYYRGYAIEELVRGFTDEGRFGFEETAYLLLFGELPTMTELDRFRAVLADYRSLPSSFIRDIIMKAPSADMMNSLTRSVLTMYAYDNNPDDTSVENVLRQCLQLIAVFPVLAVQGYLAYNYYIKKEPSYFIHNPDPRLSAAENILHMLRIDSSYTPLEAKLLDLALVLHAEHGGGNNSTFTTRVVSSSGTDTYAAIAAALGSLKGPKHGGANLKVCAMFADIKKNVSDWTDREELSRYLEKILDKQAFDGAGLIYGMGHAVYSVSDPRARVFKSFVKSLSAEKGLEKEYALYTLVEELASEAIAKKRKIYKGVSANIDFYSGFVYEMLGLPKELYTPLFAVARIVGWSAHRIEELLNGNKIIRPAYVNVHPQRKYIPTAERRGI